MRTVYLSVLALFLFSSFPLLAAPPTTYLTGDAVLDKALVDFDTRAATDKGFLPNLAQQYSLTVKELQTLLDLGMRPGEVVLSVQFSETSKKPLKDVAAAWKAANPRNWSMIAKTLGIPTKSDAWVLVRAYVAAPASGDAMMMSAKPRSDAGGMKKP